MCGHLLTSHPFAVGPFASEGPVSRSRILRATGGWRPVDCSAAASTACRRRVRRLAEASGRSTRTRPASASTVAAAYFRAVLAGEPSPGRGKGRPRGSSPGYRGPLGFLAVQFPILTEGRRPFVELAAAARRAGTPSAAADGCPHRPCPTALADAGRGGIRRSVSPPPRHLCVVRRCSRAGASAPRWRRGS